MLTSPLFWLVASLAGVCGGVFLFFDGFRKLRYKRLILDTPLSKIHSASVGLVEVCGDPVGPRTLSAPVTGDPCYYYRVQVWQWEEQDSGKSHSWKLRLDENSYVPFFLEDATGRLLIDPQNAEMELHPSFVNIVGASFFQTRDMPENIRHFMLMRGFVPYDRIKIEEHIIRPGYPLFVFGTLGENRSAASWAPRFHSAPISSVLDAQITVGPGLHVTFDSGDSNLKPRPLNECPSRWESRVSPTKTASDGSSFEEHPSMAIGKGERGDPFTISYRSQKEVVESLAWKSAFYIWGGPILAVTCFVVLLVMWSLISS